MQILQSNLLPLQTRSPTFIDKFYDLLPLSHRLDIAVGYVTTDSLVELQQLAENNNQLSTINLTIGMHYLERFTRAQYDAALRLNDFLLTSGRGEIRLVIPFRYHGKLYSMSDANGPFAGIIGSNNLGSIVESTRRVYESSYYIDDRTQAMKIREFIDQLNATSTDNIDNCTINAFNDNDLHLDEHETVSRVSPQDVYACRNAKTDISFELPLKGSETSPQSNLNVCFGKGRKGKNGFVKPRHWYEVELIVPREIASKPDYPIAGSPSAVFTVITDDGWKFPCKVSGTNNKNFRSSDDLTILGKWIKGRLENANALVSGSLVTEETFRKYGRNTITFTKTTIGDIWYLDFKV